MFYSILTVSMQIYGALDHSHAQFILTFNPLYSITY